MKTSVLRRQCARSSLLSLEPSVQKGVGALGLAAAAWLAEQDPSLWAQASDTDFLSKLAQGAMFMMQIGREKSPDMTVTDRAAHHILMTSMFLAAQAGQLSPPQKASLDVTLRLFAECCPVDLSVPTIPPIEELSFRLRRQSIMQKHYPELALAKSHYTLTLADALRLLASLEKAPSVSLVALVTGLRQLTEGLRTALRKIDPSYPKSGNHDALA